jgi:hypothetical protein
VAGFSCHLLARLLQSLDSPSKNLFEPSWCQF